MEVWYWVAKLRLCWAEATHEDWRGMKQQELSDKCKFHHPPVCRDFKKGTCELGKRCRYHHPKATSNATPAVTDNEAEAAKVETPKTKSKAKAKPAPKQAPSALKKEGE